MALLENKRLETLFRLEIEFHRRLRTAAPGAIDTGGLHTSYALQSGYEPLLFSLGRVTASDIERLGMQLRLAGDACDVLAARDSIEQMLGIRQRDG